MRTWLASLALLALAPLSTLAALEISSAPEKSDLETQPVGPVEYTAYDGTLPRQIVIEFPARPEAGFHWPYAAVLPKEPVAGAPLVIVPNNDGRSGALYDTHRYWALLEAEQTYLRFARPLGAASLVPIFPRPNDEKVGNLYTHALSRAALTASDPRLVRIDKQVLAMKADLRSRLGQEGVVTAERSLIWGFSGAGDFASRMGLLHPVEFCAVAAGGLGGLPILPLEEWKGEALTYPLGVADLDTISGRAFEAEAFRALPHLLLQGGADLNDSVPYRDSYTVEQERLVERHFGMVPPERVPQMRALYAKFGMAELTYELVPGVEHKVTPPMRETINAFFKRHAASC